MLDMRTILILTTIYGLVTGTGMILLNTQDDHHKGIRLIGVGILFYTNGFVLIALRDLIPDLISIVLANFGVLIGLMFVLEGFSVFKGLKVKWRFQNGVFLTVQIVSFYFLTVYDHHLYTNLRILIITVLSTVVLTELLYVAIKDINPVTRNGYAIVIVYQIVAVAVSIIRCVLTLRDDPLFSFMNASFIHALTIILFQLLPFVYIIGTYMVSNALMRKDLLELNMIDSLTSLYNRGAILELADKEIAKSKRHSCTTGLCMCDLDHFKTVNDVYGHLVGDQTLRHVATLLKDNLRTGDYVGRYGGEEFIIIMNCISEEDLFKRMDTLRDMIEKNPVVLEGQSLPITASFGACIISESTDLQIAIKQADNAMYEAKHSGRNQVVVYPAN